jgi:hypothetical protein
VIKQRKQFLCLSTSRFLTIRSHTPPPCLITGNTRAASSAAETRTAPGLVDWPPTSMTSAPSATMSRARCTACATCHVHRQINSKSQRNMSKQGRVPEAHRAWARTVFFVCLVFLMPEAHRAWATSGCASAWQSVCLLIHRTACPSTFCLPTGHPTLVASIHPYTLVPNALPLNVRQSVRLSVRSPPAPPSGDAVI